MIVAEVSCSRGRIRYTVSAPEPSPAEGRGPAAARGRVPSVLTAVPPRHGTRTGLADWIGSGVASGWHLIVAWSQLFG